MAQCPKITVVVPLFNKAAYIGDALASIRNQTFSDFEVVVVDDGSTDEGGNVALEVGVPALRLIRQDNAGVSIARNRGIEAAKGRLIAFLDADDAWNAQHLEHLHHLYCRFPHAGLYANAFRERRALNPAKSRGDSAVTYRLFDDYIAAAATGLTWVFTSAAMAPRQVCLALDGFPAGESRGEDLDLWIRIGLEHPVALSSYIGCIYRRVAGSLTIHPITAPDVAMRGILGRLANPTELTSQRKFALKELFNRLAIAHATDCLLHGEEAAAREFLELSADTKTHRRRWRILNLLASNASFGGPALLRLWVNLRASL